MPLIEQPGVLKHSRFPTTLQIYNRRLDKPEPKRITYASSRRIRPVFNSGTPNRVETEPNDKPSGMSEFQRQRAISILANPLRCIELLRRCGDKSGP